MHFFLCIIFYPMYSIHCNICIVFYALYSMHCIYMYCILCIVLYALYFIHCILCIVLYALYSMHCILCIVFYALYSMHCIVCIVFCALYSMNYNLYLYSMNVELTLNLVDTDRPSDHPTNRRTFSHIELLSQLKNTQIPALRQPPNLRRILCGSKLHPFRRAYRIKKGVAKECGKPCHICPFTL
jgi:hypothetical protein